MRTIHAVMLSLALSLSAWAQQGEPVLTIYNGGFATVREHLSLDLKPGINSVQFSGATSMLEPQSVLLRDPANHRSLQILEQNYRNDPITQEMLLSLYEGKIIDFYVSPSLTVKGKVIRSGYVAPSVPVPTAGYVPVRPTQPLIEVDGKLLFYLPGQPQFPALADGAILKPTLNWLVQTDRPGAFMAELGYITQGMNWNADYNIVASEKGDVVDVIGWVTIRNNTGKQFDNARIKLMAGDVNKLQPNAVMGRLMTARYEAMDKAASAPQVAEKTFDEFHLYTLQRATTLRDQETKQVEFVRASNVPSRRIYIYDGAVRPYDGADFRYDQSYGTSSNKKIWVMQEFKNSKQNNLGMPLPKGQLRFYRRDSDSSLEFVGESEIDHTPSDETIRVHTGNAFDVVGERIRTNYQADKRSFDETFEIKLRNHKKETVQVRVVEHLYRWNNWKVTAESDKHIKTDAQTMEYQVTVPPDGEKTVTYTVHYSW